MLEWIIEWISNFLEGLMRIPGNLYFMVVGAWEWFLGGVIFWFVVLMGASKKTNDEWFERLFLSLIGAVIVTLLGFLGVFSGPRID